jgi:predicted cation transporter
MNIALAVLAVLVLVLPLCVRRVEKNLELFLLCVGLIAAVASGVTTPTLITDALVKPLPIAVAVLLFGLMFYYGRARLDRTFVREVRALPRPALIFFTVVALGLFSSVATAIIAALVLVEIVEILNLPRTQEVRLTVLGCFAIGLGAALTPIGEPFSTIAVAQLHGGFFYLFNLLGIYIIPSIIFVALIAAVVAGRNINALSDAVPDTSVQTVWIRSGKVYLFVVGLMFLGAGLSPAAAHIIAQLSVPALFWVNTLSAVLDNATLAAIELSPALQGPPLVATLLSILISGSMLIPGNIPNIIAADRLKITSLEWARIGVPIGLLFMVVAFFLVVF